MLHAFGREAETELAQGGEVSLAEKMFHRLSRPLRRIHLSLRQAREQLVG